MNADGSGSQLLTRTPSARIYEPVYAGDRIAFRRMLYLTQNTFDLMLLDLDAPSLTNLSNQQFAVGSIAILPDGRRIAYSPPGGLCLIDADGWNRVRITDATGRPAWRRVY